MAGLIALALAEKEPGFDGLCVCACVCACVCVCACACECVIAEH